MTLKPDKSIKNYIRKIFMKNMLKVFNMRKLVLDLHLLLVNSLKYRQCIKKLFCKQDILKWDFQISSKTITSFMFLNTVLFIKSESHLELVTSPFSGFQKSSEVFFLYWFIIWSIFDAFPINNLCIPFLDVIIFHFQLLLKVLERWTKKVKLQKVNYLHNEKNIYRVFFDE